MEGVEVREPLPTVYLSGPMTGKPNMNFPIFNAWAGELRKLGYVVVRHDRKWRVYDRIGQQTVLTASYRDCLTYVQRANRQLDLVPIP